MDLKGSTREVTRTHIQGFENGDVVGEDRLVDHYAVRDVVEASRVVPVVSDVGDKVSAQGVGNDGVDA